MKLFEYSDKYMFDIFLCICQEDYVGDKGANSKKKMNFALCKKMTEIKMERRHDKRGIDPPDEVYAKYISFTAGLLQVASK